MNLNYLYTEYQTCKPLVKLLYKDISIAFTLKIVIY
jgi:hypothetical protein